MGISIFHEKKPWIPIQITRTIPGKEEGKDTTIGNIIDKQE
jgi:hypothetical protein